MQVLSVINEYKYKNSTNIAAQILEHHGHIIISCNNLFKDHFSVLDHSLINFVILSYEISLTRRYVANDIITKSNTKTPVDEENV